LRIDRPRRSTRRLAVGERCVPLARDLRSPSCTPHDETDREANNPHQGDDSAKSVGVADGSERCDPDRDQSDAPKEPKGNEAPPSIGLHTFLTVHGTRQSSC
jgi:hypothetical protein